MLSFIYTGLIILEQILHGVHCIQLLTFSGQIQVSMVVDSHVRSTIFTEPWGQLKVNIVLGG